MAPRITVKQLADTVATLGEAQVQILELLTRGQHATPTPVAEAVEQAAPAPAEVKPEPVLSASDQLLAYVAEQGLAFAKGGRTYQDADILKAQVRVLKTGKPEVLPYKDNVGNLHKRGVTHIAIGRTEDGNATLTQFVFDPSAR